MLDLTAQIMNGIVLGLALMMLLSVPVLWII